MIDEVYSVAVMVTHRKKSADWYKQNLGFKVETEAEDHWTVVGPNGSGSSFHLCEGQLEPGNTGILLLTNDFEVTVQELKKRGVEFTQEPKPHHGEHSQCSRIRTETNSGQCPKTDCISR